MQNAILNKRSTAYGTIFILAIVLLPLFFFYLTEDPSFSQTGRCNGGAMSARVADMRFQLLSDSLFRLEKAHDTEFEDRTTFTVVDREWPCIEFLQNEDSEGTIISADQMEIRFTEVDGKLNGFRLITKSGKSIEWSQTENPGQDFLPSPDFDMWILKDSPRLVPSSRGVAPLTDQPDNESISDSNWEIHNQGFDTYFFINGDGGYDQFRSDFLKLTGPIPLPPLFTFGLWNSRYYPYSDVSALETIKTYRDKNIPLDVFVLDTDWRKGGGVGYDINENKFPDFADFVGQVHGQQVRLVLNDHPQAVGETALHKKEIRFRYRHLTRFLDAGVDAWWYDRNWHASLKTPVPGISKELWGMYIYSDITQRHHPDRRPLVLSNVDGIDHGQWSRPSHPASHRYPVWWTGDTKPEWSYLQKAVENSVDSGVLRMMPYVSDDIGGHYGLPTDEYYIRSVQYGTFSPIFRLHSSGETRFPWDFRRETEELASQYILLRYRLLPTIYSAAYRAYKKGIPLLRRCDLYWPEYKEAVNNHQYLFGDDLLVAPVIDGKGLHTIPDHLLREPTGAPGLIGSYFNNKELSGEPVVIRNDSNIVFNWGEGKGSEPAKGVPKDRFSVRWEGKLGPIPQTGQHTFGIISDDGCRLWIGGKLVIDNWMDQGARLKTGNIYLEENQTYDFKLEYYDNAFKATCKLTWWNLDEYVEPSRSLWIPPGTWRNMWTGEDYSGPKTISVAAPIGQIPIFVRQGGLVLSTPQIMNTKELSLRTVIIDAYPARNENTTIRQLYEDDGVSVDYKTGGFSYTPIELSNKGGRPTLVIREIEGKYADMLENRTWIVRFHSNSGESFIKATVNGEQLDINDPGSRSGSIEVTLINPSAHQKGMIIQGVGDEPPPHAGSVLEIRIGDYNVNNDLKIQVER